MHRTENLARAFGLSMVMVSLLLALIVPVHGSVADKAASQPPMGPSAPGQVNCVQTPQAPEAPAFVVSAGACRAETTPETLPDWARGGRTCRCSCGFPCKTDADCGGGIGSCRGGISCC